MGRKVDVKLMQLENKVKMIETNLEGCIKIQDTMIEKRNESMIQMRDLLNKLIEGQ